MGYVGDRKRAYQCEWYKKRRDAFFSGKVCSECGSGAKLELHHVDPSKKKSNSIWTWSKERQLREIAKCIVLCSDCHEKLPSAKKRRPLVHGTIAGYKTKGCRCERCTEAVRIYQRQYRSRVNSGDSYDVNCG